MMMIIMMIVLRKTEFLFAVLCVSHLCDFLRTVLKQNFVIKINILSLINQSDLMFLNFRNAISLAILL